MRSRARGLALVSMSLALLACFDGTPVGPPAQYVRAISGDVQPAKAGLDLAEPFVVRVTNAMGRGLQGAQVTWTVTSGEGILGGDRGTDCSPKRTVSMRTDARGYARMSFRPTWFGPTTVTARPLYVTTEPATFTTDASDPGVTLEVVSGDNQQGRAGEALPELLCVRVTDGVDRPVADVEVVFTVTDEVGHGFGGCEAVGQPAGSAATRTTLPGWSQSDDPGGVGCIVFEPIAQGVFTVSATVPADGVSVDPAFFTLEGVGVLIRLIESTWPGAGAIFRGPGGGPWVTVPVGTSVEWEAHILARIASISMPPDGASFDSGELEAGERFEFVPEVAGTWIYQDRYTGALGELTVD
jgi:hypothetical protein